MHGAAEPAWRDAAYILVDLLTAHLLPAMHLMRQVRWLPVRL